MDKNLFEFNDYRAYLRLRLEGGKNRGNKALFAEAIGVQAAYISQVVGEKAHLSLEQAEASNKFFQHTSEESHYFLLCVQKDRAGTKSLREYFQKQMETILQSRLVLTKRLDQVKTINDEDRAWYYSSWVPIAIHMACTIPHLQTAENLSKALSLPVDKVVETMDHLEKIGLLQKSGLKYIPAIQQIRIGRDSFHVIKHHTNLRVLAIDSLVRETLEDMHYSAVVSLSKKDAVKIKNMLLEHVKSAQAIIKESPEEELYALNIDLFNLVKQL